MTTETETAMPTTTIPPELLPGLSTYYGVQLIDIGDDGDVMVLGHHDAPRRVVAALNRHARLYWGMPNLYDDRSPGAYTDTLKDLMPRWARLVPPEQGEDWRVTWAAKSTDDAAFPITMWHV